MASIQDIAARLKTLHTRTDARFKSLPIPTQISPSASYSQSIVQIAKAPHIDLKQVEYIEQFVEQELQDISAEIEQLDKIAGEMLAVIQHLRDGSPLLETADSDLSLIAAAKAVRLAHDCGAINGQRIKSFTSRAFGKLTEVERVLQHKLKHCERMRESVRVGLAKHTHDYIKTLASYAESGRAVLDRELASMLPNLEKHTSKSHLALSDRYHKTYYQKKGYRPLDELPSVPLTFTKTLQECR